MSDFRKCNYASGFYASTDNIDNFNFKVTIKEVYKNTLLIRSNGASEELNNDLCADNVGYHEERSFKWQEKVALLNTSNEEVEEDVSENLTSANEETETKRKSRNKLISYVTSDNYNVKVKLTTDQKETPILGDAANKKLPIFKKNMSKNIEKAENNEDDDVDGIQKMFIAVNIRDTEANQKLQKDSEHVLFAITWNVNEKCLVITPDFNDIKINPYLFERHEDSKKLFHYSIEQIVPQMIDDKKLSEMNLLQKISEYENECETRKMFHNFPLPAKRSLRCVITFEIVSGCLFEYDNLYVEYQIEMPDGCKCDEPLKGTTQMVQTKGKNRSAHFGHLFELTVDYAADVLEDDLPEKPCVYFEIISCDSWERHRTEGYCFVQIPVTQPGTKKIVLNAFNVESTNRVRWNMDRYFIGGCHVLKDITVIGVPNTFQGDCLVKHGMVCQSMGKLTVAMNVILQSDAFVVSNVSDDQKHVVEKLHVDSLFKSVNAVLSAYKSAKRQFDASMRRAKRGDESIR